MTRRWGRAYDAWSVALVLRQKANGGDGETCEKCMKHEDKHGIKTLIVAHPNGYDEKKIPRLEDLALWHQSCNIKEDPPNQFPRDIPQIERERALKPTKFELEKGMTNPSSSEKADHDKMRPRFDDWIAGRITRSSMHDYPCQLWQNALVNIREWCDLAQLEQRAVYACGLGSSKTYHTYALEDVQGGKLEKETREGQIMVRYTYEFMGLVAANLKASLEKFKEAQPQPKEQTQA